MSDDIFDTYGFSDTRTRFPTVSGNRRIGSAHSPRSLHNGLVVFVVVSVKRGMITQSSLQDNQTDIDILGVFTSEQNAKSFCGVHDPLRNRLVIHQSTIRSNPELNTFHSEIYS